MEVLLSIKIKSELCIYTYLQVCTVCTVYYELPDYQPAHLLDPIISIFTFLLI